MAFDIEEFKARIEDGGILQNNKYDVNIFFPQNSGMQGTKINTGGAEVYSADISQDLSFRTINATLPGIALRTVDSARYGLGIQEKMVFSGNYTDIDLTFVCDKFGDAYRFWYSWLNYIFSVSGQTTRNTVSNINANRPFYTAQYKDLYAATVVITVYDPYGEVALTYYLYKAFPVSLNDVPLSWADKDGILKITTKISFREWALDGGSMKLNKVSSSPRSQPTGLAGTGRLGE
jgi:hypothetical protein